MISRNSRQPISKIAKMMASFSACAVVLLSTAAAEACPMCKTALGSNAQHFINAWGASIVFMLSMPFLLVGSFSVYMFMLVKRARAEQAAKQASPAYASARSELDREAALVD